MQSVIRRLNQHYGSDTPWLLLLDLCPLHVSLTFRTWLQDEFPHIQLAYVEGDTTGICQPLDLHFMRPFKLSLRAAVSKQFALKMVTCEEYTVKEELSRLFLKGAVTRWVGDALDKLKEKHAARLLFPLHRGRIPEEHAEAPLEVVAQESQEWDDVEGEVQVLDAAGEDEEEWREEPATAPPAPEQELSEAVDQLVDAGVLPAAAPEPEVPAAPAASSSAAAGEADSSGPKVISKFLALQLVYGRGPDGSAKKGKKGAA